MGAAAVLGIVALAGCGLSSVAGPQAAQARSHAADGCHQILGVGQAMERHQPASGQAIDHQLREATANLDAAAKLDGRWTSLDHAARSLVSALEGGQTPDSQLVVSLTNGCQPFAGTSASNGAPAPGA